MGAGGKQRALLAKVDCTQEQRLCQEQQIMGFPTVRVYTGKSTSSFREYDGDRTAQDIVRYVHQVMPDIDGFTEDDEEYKKLVAERESEMNKAMEKRVVENGDSHGCNIVGTVEVMKVPGTLVFSAHSNYESLSLEYLNMSHIIHHLAFRSPEDEDLSKLEPVQYQNYVDTVRSMKEQGEEPGPVETYGTYARRIMRDHKIKMEGQLPLMNVGSIKPFMFPLNGKRFATESERGIVAHYVKVVHSFLKPTAGWLMAPAWAPWWNRMQELYQHQVHSGVDAVLPKGQMPMLNFSYDISPLAYEYSLHDQGYAEFLTNLCAIIGGVFTVIGLVDNVIYYGAGSILKMF